MRINPNFSALTPSYLFAQVAERTAAYQTQHPDQRLLRLGIGDVTQPLCPAAVTAMEQAARQLGSKEGFYGYGPYEGYAFLREAIAGYMDSLGAPVQPEEVFVSDGAKSDLGNLLDLFDPDCPALIPDPVYPAYVDANCLAGRQVAYTGATWENGFLPMPKGRFAGLIYLCSPNNPTGAAYSRDQLKKWVDAANRDGAIILYDAAYAAFVTRPNTPRSILSIPGARSCAIEIGSFSKMAGFTGVRCGYTLIPKELEREGIRLGDAWLRRQSAKYNGASYLVQRGAQAVLSKEGQAQVRAALDIYRGNAQVMAQALEGMGLAFTGGKDSPYLWLRCPDGLSSWAFFDRLLTQAQVVGTPGSGFGKNGEGYFRLTAFGDAQETREAMARMASVL